MDYDPPHRRPGPTSTQEITLWIAGALLTLACFGFLPRLATEIEYLDLGRLRSETLLFGLLHVSVLHNLLHLLLGAAAVVSAGSQRVCRTFLASAGVGILVLTLYGHIDRTPAVPDLVPIGRADSWLHTLLALTMLFGAVLPSRRRRAIDPASTADHRGPA